MDASLKGNRIGLPARTLAPGKGKGSSNKAVAHRARTRYLFRLWTAQDGGSVPV